MVLPVKTGNTAEVDFSRWRALVHSQTGNTLVVEVCSQLRYQTENVETNVVLEIFINTSLFIIYALGSN